MSKWGAFWGLCLIYGAGFLFINLAVSEIPPIPLTTIRLALGAVALGAIVYHRGERIPTDRRHLFDFAVIGVLNVALPFTLVTWAMQMGLESGVASVLTGTYPLFMLVLAHFAFMDERITWRKFAGVLIGFTGVVILSARHWQDGADIQGGILNQGLMIGAQFLFALSAVYSRKVMQGNVAPLVVASGSMVFAALAMIGLTAVLLLVSPASVVPAGISLQGVGATLYLILFNTSLAYILLFYIIRELGPSRASTVVYAVTPISITLGAIFLDELIDLYLIAGAIIVLSGVAIVNLRLPPRLRPLI